MARTDGPGEYLFGEINAGSLLADGSVVVSDRMNFRIQRFGPDGEHLWSRGREGEGPGEFENVQSVHGCVSADRIVVYDIWTQRVSVFNDEGDLVDDYRLLYNGLPIRRIRWQGPDLNVTQRDVDRYRDALEGSYRRGGNPDWRARFERRWAWESENVPDVFPAYDRLMIGDDGVLWVHDYVRPGEPSEWFAFAADGTWIRTLVLPPRTLLLDIGRDWALVRTLDDVDVQRVAVHALMENR